MPILDLIFPKTCLECGSGKEYLCPKCLKNLSKIKPICPKCLKPSIDGFTHTRCITPLGLDGLYSIWPYEKVMRKAILRLKYNFASDIAAELSNKASKNINNWLIAKGLNNIILVPIPVHGMRKNWRGFNQTEIIGKEIAENMNWKYIPDLIIREKLLVPQTNLKGKERRKNIRGAFTFNKVYKNINFANYTALIFDDVWTTGSTVMEVGKIVKRKKIAKVWALTLSRSIQKLRKK